MKNLIHNLNKYKETVYNPIMEKDKLLIRNLNNYISYIKRLNIVKSGNNSTITAKVKYTIDKQTIIKTYMGNNCSQHIYTETSLYKASDFFYHYIDEGYLQVSLAFLSKFIKDLQLPISLASEQESQSIFGYTHWNKATIKYDMVAFRDKYKCSPKSFMYIFSLMRYFHTNYQENTGVTIEKLYNLAETNNIPHNVMDIVHASLLGYIYQHGTYFGIQGGLMETFSSSYVFLPYIPTYQRFLIGILGGFNEISKLTFRAAERLSQEEVSIINTAITMYRLYLYEELRNNSNVYTPDTLRDTLALFKMDNQELLELSKQIVPMFKEIFKNNSYNYFNNL